MPKEKHRVTEPYISRDHSELMLSAFGADIHTEGHHRDYYSRQNNSMARRHCWFRAISPPLPSLSQPDSSYRIQKFLIKNVGINPTRDGILRVCKAMNADVELLNVNTHLRRTDRRPARPLR